MSAPKVLHLCDNPDCGASTDAGHISKAVPCEAWEQHPLLDAAVCATCGFGPFEHSVDAVLTSDQRMLIVRALNTERNLLVRLYWTPEKGMPAWAIKQRDAITEAIDLLGLR